MRSLILNWEFNIITSQDKRFITSDHPVIFFTSNEDRLAFAVLPIMPNLLAVASDKRKITIKSDKATTEDVIKLNRY